MRLAAVIWLGLISFHHTCQSLSTNDPGEDRSVNQQQTNGLYRSVLNSVQRRRMQPYQPKLQSDVPVAQPYMPSLRRASIRRPVSRVATSRQAYVPKMVSDPLVVEPYKPVMRDSVVVQPYRPQLMNDMLVQLFPGPGYGYAGSRTSQTQQEYMSQKPLPIASQTVYRQEAPQTDKTASSTMSPVTQYQDVQQKHDDEIKSVTKGTYVDITAIPSTTQAPLAVTPCKTQINLPLPQMIEETTTQSTYSTTQGKISMVQPAETVEIYDGFQVEDSLPPVRVDERLVEAYQPIIEVVQPVFVAEAALALQYRSTSEQIIPHEATIEAGTGPLPYRPTSEQIIPHEATIEAGTGPLPYRPTLEQIIPQEATIEAGTGPLPYRPTLEQIKPYMPTIEADAGILSYRPNLKRNDVESRPYRPNLEREVVVELPYRPNLDRQGAALQPYRPVFLHNGIVEESALLIQPYQPLLTKDDVMVKRYEPAIEQDTSIKEPETLISETTSTVEPKASETVTTTEKLYSQSAFVVTTSSQEVDAVENPRIKEVEIQSTTGLGVRNISPNDVEVLKDEEFVDSVTPQSIDSTTEDALELTETSTMMSSVSTGLCAGLDVGVHRHPDKCDGIIRCDGVRTYLMPSCPAGLLFNNNTKACDYPNYVPECSPSLASDAQVNTDCNGYEHGAHIPDEKECGVFWRCVWDRLVKMNCPKGTFFNELTAVCDWPRSVPECNSDGVRLDTEIDGSGQIVGQE